MWNYRLAVSVATTGVAVTLIAAAAGWGGAPSTRDRERETATSSVGYVDLDSVSTEIKKTPKWQKLFQQANEKRQELANQLDQLVQRRHLTEAESKELDVLILKPKPTDGEKERKAKLLAKSNDLDEEFNKLANIPSDKMTPEETTRLQALAKLRSDAAARLQKERAQREDQLRDLETKMLNDVQEQITKIVGEVAKAQGVEVVVDRAALLYGGRDLTSLVIQKLPKT